MVKKLLKKQLQKKADITSAAIEIFAKKGFRRTKISEIASLAKVADGTIYLYFANKEDLLINAFDKVFNDCLQEVKNRLSELDSKLERLHKFFEFHAEFFTKNPLVARFITLELRQTNDFYGYKIGPMPFKSYLAYIKQLCQDAMDSGEIKPGDPEQLAVMFYGIMDFALTKWIVQGQDTSLEKLVQTAVEVFRKGLKP